ncbi:hypothetical protein [Mesobacillus jeotgali]|uniref:hypothetical protein n=1 Tax=Mesobacillus jeotgali TaxID=129985 RepID=UPI0009A8D428|nr:hypothetical protein [Mesobacillus jeotgali]
MDDQDLINLIKNLNDKLDSMQTRECHFHIDKVTIDQLQLEELSYQLDKIEIKELSGMLNLGNAFSPEIQSMKSKSKPVDIKPSPDKQGKTQENEDRQQEDTGKTDIELQIIVNGKEIMPD